DHGGPQRRGEDAGVLLGQQLLRQAPAVGYEHLAPGCRCERDVTVLRDGDLRAGVVIDYDLAGLAAGRPVAPVRRGHDERVPAIAVREYDDGLSALERHAGEPVRLKVLSAFIALDGLASERADLEELQHLPIVDERDNPA